MKPQSGSARRRKYYFRAVLHVERRYLIEHQRCDTPEKAAWRSNSDGSLFQCFGCESYCGSSQPPIARQRQLELFQAQKFTDRDFAEGADEADEEHAEPAF